MESRNCVIPSAYLSSTGIIHSSTAWPLVSLPLLTIYTKLWSEWVKNKMHKLILDIEGPVPWLQSPVWSVPISNLLHQLTTIRTKDMETETPPLPPVLREQQPKPAPTDKCSGTTQDPWPCYYTSIGRDITTFTYTVIELFILEDTRSSGKCTKIVV